MAHRRMEKYKRRVKYGKKNPKPRSSDGFQDKRKFKKRKKQRKELTE